MGDISRTALAEALADEIRPHRGQSHPGAIAAARIAERLGVVDEVVGLLPPVEPVCPFSGLPEHVAAGAVDMVRGFATGGIVENVPGRFVPGLDHRLHFVHQGEPPK